MEKSTNLQIQLLERQDTDGPSDVAGLLVIPRHGDANREIAERVGEQIQSALERGIELGLWSEEELDDVVIPIGPHLDEYGALIEGEACVVTPYVIGYMNGQRVCSDELFKRPLGDVEIEMEPRLDDKIGKYLLAIMHVYLDPQSKTLA